MRVQAEQELGGSDIGFAQVDSCNSEAVQGTLFSW